MKIVNNTGNPFDTKLLRDNGEEIADDILSHIGKITINVCGGKINTAIIELSDIGFDFEVDNKHVELKPLKDSIGNKD